LAKQSVQTIQENFTIEPFCTAADELGVLVKNVGTNALQVATVWYVEQTGTAFTEIPLDVSLEHRYVPPGSTVDVISDKFIPLGPLSGIYTIKVVTMLGNILESDFNSDCPIGDEPLADELFAKPAVYAAFPNPWSGKMGAGYGYIALIVVNPTPHLMTVYRTSFSLMTSENPNAFPLGSTINAPSANPWGGTWGTASDAIWWQSNAGTPIPAYSVKEFVAKVFPTSTINKSPINTVNTNTITSFGQFGGIKIDTIETLGDEFGTPNIFLVDDNVDTTPSYTINNLVPVDPQYLYVALHNSSGSEQIDANSKLVINIPSAFKILNNNLDVSDPLNGSAGGGGFDSGPGEPVSIAFDDNSIQLTYNLSADMASGGIARIGIEMIPPELATNTVYIFHSYAYGTTTVPLGPPGPPGGTELIGPVSEFAVRICKVGGC